MFGAHSRGGEDAANAILAFIVKKKPEYKRSKLATRALEEVEAEAEKIRESGESGHY